MAHVYPVAEIFESINGEGTKAGRLAVFVRFSGCNLNCTFCDTLWANAKDCPVTYMTCEDIYTRIKSTGISLVTLTGGEPLLQPKIEKLLAFLEQDATIEVEIETNGSISLAFLENLAVRPTITMDYKLPGSGMEAQMCTDNFSYLRKADTVKFVVGSLEDMDRAVEIITQYKLSDKCHLYFSPVFGRIAPADIVEYMKEHNLNYITMQLQMHKFIWDPDKRGV